MKLLKLTLSMFILIGIFSSCSKDEQVEPKVLNLETIEITKNSVQTAINKIEENSNLKFNGRLINAEIVSLKGLKNMKSNIDTENTIHIQVQAENGEIINIYSSPSLINANETIVFSQVDGVVKDEIKFNFFENTDGSMNFSTEIITESKGFWNWGSCMQSVLSDPFVGTIIQVGAIAGGVGCVPCGAVSAILTGFAAIGCLG